MSILTQKKNKFIQKKKKKGTKEKKIVYGKTMQNLRKKKLM